VGLDEKIFDRYDSKQVDQLNGSADRLDAPASDSDADVGCPMPWDFPLPGNRE